MAEDDEERLGIEKALSSERLTPAPISDDLLVMARAISEADLRPSALRVEVSIRLISEANARGSWHAGATRARAHRGAVGLALGRRRENLSGHLIIALTRIGPRALDGDNAARALKAVRDGVADWLRRDDGDAGLTWLAQQERGAYGVRIEIWRWEP